MTRNLLLTYYGDDFTGSTDVMESLARVGIRTALFLEPPDADTLARFPGLGALGVAGTGRTMTPAAMTEALLDAFTRLAALGAPLMHYKICSTFDSSRQVGNIGRAIELGQTLFGSPVVPLMVGAPVLGRYCAFGNLFARSGLDSEPYRLDRHPTMSHHPVTPMRESDLRVHLSHQTTMRSELVSLLDLASEAAARRRVAAIHATATVDDPSVALFDVLDDEQLPIIGQVVWEAARREPPLFAAGSSGLEYALTAHWRRMGLLGEPPRFAPVPGVERLVVASGSCSPVTDQQIAWALERGFAEIALEPARLVDPELAGGEMERAAWAAEEALAGARGVIMHTCRGPRDPRIQDTTRRLAALDPAAPGARLGEALGRVLRTVLDRTGLRRAAVTGGDTSGYVARALGVEALEMVGPLAPGAPLCRMYAPRTALHGREVVFKGGQVGTANFFGRVIGEV